jgi:hypothetical protein
MSSQILYRPVGLKELELIADSNFKAFPPRFDWQPVFYPVLNSPYATEIAEKWNTKDAASDFVGFVTKFALPTAYLKQFEVQNVGGSIHNELWIPAAQLAEFNANIIGAIEIEEVFYGPQYTGITTRGYYLKSLTVNEQWEYLLSIGDDDSSLLTAIIKEDWLALLVNFSYFNEVKTDSFLTSQIRFYWHQFHPNLKLFV